jgi:hypothetical protein
MRLDARLLYTNVLSLALLACGNVARIPLRR